MTDGWNKFKPAVEMQRAIDEGAMSGTLYAEAMPLALEFVQHVFTAGIEHLAQGNSSHSARSQASFNGVMEHWLEGQVESMSNKQLFDVLCAINSAMLIASTIRERLLFYTYERSERSEEEE